MIEKKTEKNNITTVLNVLYAKREKIYPAFASKHNSNREKQAIILMISNGEKMSHYLAVKNLSELLMVVFIVWISFIPLEQKTNLNGKKSMWK